MYVHAEKLPYFPSWRAGRVCPDVLLPRLVFNTLAHLLGSLGHPKSALRESYQVEVPRHFRMTLAEPKSTYWRQSTWRLEIDWLSANTSQLHT